MKKFIFSLITLITAVAFMLGLVACGHDTHTWSDKWSSNGANHWHDCTDSGCKQRSDITPHTWFLTSTLENATCTEEGLGVYTCFICGRAKNDVIEKSGHNWKLIYTEYPANCITEGRGSYRCADCAIIQDKMIIPPTGAHSFDTAWSCDKAGHYHVCTVAGCGAKTDSINHVETGPVTIEAEDYKDGADEMRCADCGYVISSVVRPAKGIPKSFDVKFGSTEATDGKVVLKANLGYALSYPNAVNVAGNSISALPYYSSGTGMAIYVLTDVDQDLWRQVTASSGDEIGFSTNQSNLYTKAAGVYKVAFRFMVDDVLKAETILTIVLT